jgi:RNA polymerase sigma-70 factor (ECF subfamily)
MSDSKQLLENYCRKSDLSAFNTFYRQQVDRLWRYLRARGCSDEDAYDLVSESFLKFIQVVCKELRAPVALLYRIAINLRIDSYRRGRASPLEPGHQESMDQYPADPAAAADLQAYVRGLIKNLPDHEQNLLLLRYWIGLTHKEIAVGLEIPEGTVRRQCAEALNKLKQRWQEE